MDGVAKRAATARASFEAQAAAIDRLNAAVVGRQAQRARLLRAWEHARHGQMGWVLLAAPPGYGKTRLARELVAHAEADGALVLWGGCLEADWRPSYGPWRQALSAVADQAERLQSLGSSAALLAPLFPDAAPAAPAFPSLSPAEERLRRYEALVRLLVAVARQQPLLLVLDDVHWADADSLDLLAYVARSLPRHTPLLALVAYRDTPVDRSSPHAFADLLLTLQRDAIVKAQHLALAALDTAEVSTWLVQVAHHAVPPALAERLYAAASGHPFYTHELIRHLLDTSAGPANSAPPGVQMLLDQRLSRLSPAVATVLHAACVLAGPFDVPLLQVLVGLDVAALDEALTEALAAGLLRAADTATSTGGACAFAHAIVRQALYERLSPGRRAAFHRRAAEALQRLPGARALRAAEVAAHYRASLALPGAERGVSFALAAAEEARRAYATQRVVDCLRLARDLATATGTPPAALAPILSQLAVAEAEAMDLDAAPTTARAAAQALLLSEPHPRQAAELLAAIARPLKEAGAEVTTWRPLVEHGLALVGEQRDLTWARLMLLQDRYEVLVNSGPVIASRWLGHEPQAVALARQAGTEADYAHTLETVEWRTPAETAQVLALARQWRQPPAVLRALNVVARDVLLQHGDLSQAEERGKELLTTATAYQSLLGQADALTQLASVRMARGEWLLARQSVLRAEDLVRQLGTVHRLRLVVQGSMAGAFGYYLDDVDWSTLAASLAHLAAADRPGHGAILGLLLGNTAALAYARAGDAAAARRYLTVVTPLLQRMAPTMHHHNSAVHVGGCVVWELRDRDLAPIYRHLARDLLAAGVGDSPSGCSELTELRMDALLGRLEPAQWDAARAHAEATGQDAVRAMIDYDESLAHSLAGDGRPDHTRSRALLDAAEAGFRRLGLAAWAARCGRDRAGSNAPRRANPAGLTPREIDVLRLLAHGCTTAEVAAQLVLSPGTVERHITHIYTKIGARGRADATAFALQHGLAWLPPTGLPA